VLDEFLEQSRLATEVMVDDAAAVAGSLADGSQRHRTRPVLRDQCRGGVEDSAPRLGAAFGLSAPGRSRFSHGGDSPSLADPRIPA
jgi:hypothetical protein